MRRAAVFVITLAALLSGCSTPAATLPGDVTVSVFQNRFDYSLRQLEIKVSNGTDAPITVSRAAFESARFAEPAVWDRPQQIPAGGARDLRVQLAAPRCDADDATVDTVTLEVVLADGSSTTATLTPLDEQGTVDAVNAQDCLEESVAAVATIAPGSTLEWTPGAHEPASLDLTVTPTGAAGRVTIRDARATVLLALADEQGAPLAVRPVDLVVDAGTAAAVIRLSVVPGRCDKHAVEEDKRGTFFPLDVQADDGTTGTLYIAVGDGVRRSLYEFYADYCGLPSA